MPIIPPPPKKNHSITEQKTDLYPFFYFKTSINSRAFEKRGGTLERPGGYGPMFDPTRAESFGP